jgi:glycosyltransferase involved in cell wall biosynthesis
MADDSLRRQMGVIGKKAVYDRFTWAACAQKYMQLYSEVLADNQN